MLRTFLACLVGLALTWSSPAAAQNLSAAYLEKVPAGTVVKFPVGAYGPADIGNVRPLPEGLTLDFTGSTVAGLRVWKAKGLTIVGGRWAGVDVRRGLEIKDSERVIVRDWKGVWATVWAERVKGLTIDGIEAHKVRGFYAEASSDVVLRRGLFVGSAADAINFNGLTNALFEDLAVIGSGYDHANPLSDENQHPDAIQGWGNNSKLTFRRIAIACRCQGIFIKDGTNESVVIDDVTAILDDYKWVVAVQNSKDPPLVSRVVARGTPGSPSPALDFRGAKTATPYATAGEILLNGRSPTSVDVMLK